MLVPIHPGSAISHIMHPLLSRFCPLHVLVDCTVYRISCSRSHTSVSPNYPYPTMPIHKLLPHRLCIEVSTPIIGAFSVTQRKFLQIKAHLTAFHSMQRSGLYQRTIRCASTFPGVRVPLIFRIFVRHSNVQGAADILLVCTANIIYLGGRLPCFDTNATKVANKQRFKRQTLTCDVSFVRKSLFGNYPEWKKAERT
jgi:hypothetical protein